MDEKMVKAGRRRKEGRSKKNRRKEDSRNRLSIN